ncbi:LytR/AlgR family response regulator transcription factor [Runella sp.]|uniref:LytR/AlgR family response regulator transcription factor n=1 Tax=Runella sp. TaxID=1960881 RepID=UPI003D0B41F0
MNNFSGVISYESVVTLPRFQTKSGECAIDLQQIVYLSAQSNYTMFHLKSGERVITSLPLSMYSSALEAKGFIRIHKTYLLNLIYLDQCTILRFERVTLPTGEIITIARRRRKTLKKMIRNQLIWQSPLLP